MFRERLPIWFQATAMSVLCAACVATFLWVCWQEKNPPQGVDENRWRYAIEDRTRDILYLAMPMPIIFLGVRLAWRAARAVEKEDGGFAAAVAFFSILILLLPAVLAFAYWWMPMSQRVRESGYAQVVVNLEIDSNEVNLIR